MLFKRTKATSARFYIAHTVNRSKYSTGTIQAHAHGNISHTTGIVPTSLMQYNFKKLTFYVERKQSTALP